MFEKFGEFDSPEEINRAAAAQKEQGDEDALILLAEENGIDREDAEDYYDGALDELATPAMAAIGKLAVESKDLKLGGILLDWVDELRTMCVENEAFARAVRRKGKGLDGYIALTAEEGYKNRAVVDRRIVDKTEQIKKILGGHEFSIGIPNKKTRRDLAMSYYMG
ncbi:MAG: hypothetical protein K2H45_04270 [Acetatifactor sp.]|nr:hypothetical protein [Acetatifactor sp.]